MSGETPHPSAEPTPSPQGEGFSPAGGTGDEGERIATPVRNGNEGTGGASPSPTKGPASSGKGQMARRLVYYCIGVLTLTAVWAAVVVTVAVWRGVDVDLSAILTFIGGAFGGELLLLLLKRVFAKPKEDVE